MEVGRGASKERARSRREQAPIVFYPGYWPAGFTWICLDLHLLFSKCSPFEQVGILLGMRRKDTLRRLSAYSKADLDPLEAVKSIGGPSPVQFRIRCPSLAVHLYIDSEVVQWRMQSYHAHGLAHVVCVSPGLSKGCPTVLQKYKGCWASAGTFPDSATLSNCPNKRQGLGKVGERWEGGRIGQGGSSMEGQAGLGVRPDPSPHPWACHPWSRPLRQAQNHSSNQQAGRLVLAETDTSVRGHISPCPEANSSSSQASIGWNTDQSVCLLQCRLGCVCVCVFSFGFGCKPWNSLSQDILMVPVGDVSKWLSWIGCLMGTKAKTTSFQK